MNKADFLSNGVKTKEVLIESMGKNVFIRGMSFAAASAIAECESLQDKTLTLVLYGLCDDAGELLFAPSDRFLLANSMPFDVIREIADKVLSISSNTQDELVK